MNEMSGRAGEDRGDIEGRSRERRGRVGGLDLSGVHGGEWMASIKQHQGGEGAYILLLYPAEAV
jgi:hypothetical protein